MGILYSHVVDYPTEDGSVDSALLRIELDYVVLYAYSLALRALQGKLRRRRQVGDRHYHSPSLLNMVEGPWIMESLSAARSIIEITLTVLEERKMLRYCPSRIFQYILFATTFLYKVSYQTTSQAKARLSRREWSSTASRTCLVC